MQKKKKQYEMNHDLATYNIQSTCTTNRLLTQQTSENGVANVRKFYVTAFEHRFSTRFKETSRAATLAYRRPCRLVFTIRYNSLCSYSFAALKTSESYTYLRVYTKALTSIPIVDWLRFPGVNWFVISIELSDMTTSFGSGI